MTPTTIKRPPFASLDAAVTAFLEMEARFLGAMDLQGQVVNGYAIALLALDVTADSRSDKEQLLLAMEERARACLTMANRVRADRAAT